MKDLQKLRKRPHGVNIIGLAIGERINSTNDSDSVSLNSNQYIKTYDILNHQINFYILERFIQT